MNAYTTFYDKLPHHVQVSFQQHGIFNIEADGEVLLNIRLEEPELWTDIIEDVASASSVTVTDVTRLEVTNLLENLTNKASQGQPTKFYSTIQLEVLRNTKRSRIINTKTDDLSLLVKKWRHWKPGAKGPKEVTIH